MENIDPLTHIKKLLLGFQQHLKKRDEAIESRFAELTRQSEEAFEKFASMSEQRLSQLEDHLSNGSDPNDQTRYLTVVESSGQIHYIPRSDGDYVSLTLLPNAIKEIGDRKLPNAEDEYALRAIEAIISGSSPYSIRVKFHYAPWAVLEITTTHGEAYAKPGYIKDSSIMKGKFQVDESLKRLCEGIRAQSIQELTPDIFDDIPLQVHFRPSLIG